MAGHAFLNTKNRGVCRSLTGDVLITVILVDDKENSWTTADMDAFRKEQMGATAKLLKEARMYHAYVKINVQYMRCKIDAKFTMSDTESCVDKALKACGFKSEKSVTPMLKKRHNAKEVPVIFAINRPGRSYAQPQMERDEFEYCVLYSEHGDYRHELYHMFGAKDFYYPECVEKSANKYFPFSIMKGADDPRVDDLTAYLIGWTDTLSDSARKFLDETSWITQEYIDSYLEEEVMNGVGTIRYSGGNYTGDIVDGAPHGNGKIIWDSGAVYEGEWRDGHRHGKGTMTWTDGKTTYVGDWVKGQMTGYGVCTFPNGSKQSGRWEKGEFKGGR